MGGKGKQQAQRTKNNSRPSNSGRSAELLNNVGFVGFSSNDNSSSFVPIVPGFTSDNILPEDFDSTNIDSSYQMVLKKMTKKDATTKNKAMMEFIELVSAAEMEKVKEILPFWPRFYSFLSTDVDHRVRENAQLSQAAVINKVGKHIAPYLKQLAPSWITSQYDTYAPAASIASSTLQKAFPPHKLKEVFMFCQNEILDYIIKNLTVQTAQTLCNPKSYTQEESEAKYQRLVISSLKGYSLYIEKMDSAQLLEATEKNTLLIDNPKFWSLYNHKVASIRAAWYEVIENILQHAIFLLEKHEEKLTPYVFNNLDESEPIVISHVWASILLVQEHFENWYKHVNFQKSLKPKLWKTLQNGGNGCASVIFPHLLPMISKLDDKILSDKFIQFYIDFFDNMKICIQLPVIQTSRSDITSVSTAYFECFQYIIIQMQTNKLLEEPELEDFCVKLIDDNILNIIEWSFNSSSFTNQKYLYGQIAKLLYYWSQNTDNKMYQRFVTKIWTSLHEMISNSLSDSVSADDLNKISDAHIQFILSLKQNLILSGRRKQVSVKFSNVTGDEVDSPTDTNVTTSTQFENDLNSLIFAVCDGYIKKINLTKNPNLIERLETIFKHFDNALLYYKLSKSSDSCKNLCEIFLNWLSNDKPLKLEIVVEILLKIYKCMSEEDQIEILNRLIKCNDEQIQNWIITRILSHPLCNLPFVPKLLAQSEVTDFLVKTANKIIHNCETTENLNLLHKCFFQNDAGDILIDSLTCSRIIDTMSIPLTDDSMIDVLDECGSFVAQIMPVIFTDKLRGELQVNLFLRLFEFSINKMVSDDLSEDTLWEITTAWQDAMSSNDLKLTEDVLAKCTKIIENKLQECKTKDDLCIETLENITDMTSKLILCSTEHIKDDAEKLEKLNIIIKFIMNLYQNEFEKNVKTLKDFCLFNEVINGRLTDVSVTNDHVTNCSYEKVLKDITIMTIFKLNIIFNISCCIKKSDQNEKGDDAMEVDEELTDDYYDAGENLIKNWSDTIYGYVNEIVYSTSMLNIVLENNVKLSDLESSMLYTGEKLDLLLKHITPDQLQKITTNLFDKTISKGSLWSYCLQPLLRTEKYKEKHNGAILLYEDVLVHSAITEVTIKHSNVIQYLLDKIPKKCLPIEIDSSDYSLNNILSMSCFILNHFTSNINDIGDHKVIVNTLAILTGIIAKSKEDINFLLYNKDITAEPIENIIFVTEVINLVTKAIKYFPTELDISKMDFIRIAISSWTLTVSQNINNILQPKISIFAAAVYKLFETFTNFIAEEKLKSSTEFLSNVIEEWEQIFAKDVNLVLLKCFMNVVNNDLVNQSSMNKFNDFVVIISSCTDSIELAHVLKSEQIDSKTTLKNLLEFCLKNISHNNHSVRIASASIINRLAEYYIKKDVDQLNTYNEQTEKQNKEELPQEWHFLNLFKTIIDEHNSKIKIFIEDFSLKMGDIKELEPVDKTLSIPYFILWECIVNICSKASSEMRSIYASWLTDNEYEQIVLMVLFRTMPTDVLKYPDTKMILGQTLFIPLEWRQIKNPNLSSERYACHMYNQMLRFLPALVRKWWHDLPQRQSQLIDKVTTNFVSARLCQDELRGILDKRDKYENMSIMVHTSTREVHATYSMDETKMELIINLPINHPLGTVKVESGRQIGGRLQSRVLVMQLTIFLTHQNGSIWDGLSLWKRNLDRKFEGVEECYVCYSVIHQDTCQLPKLSCKTCRKKFHGPCLYKWFSTSNKSTCPICRNIF